MGALVGIGVGYSFVLLATFYLVEIQWIRVCVLLDLIEHRTEDRKWIISWIKCCGVAKRTLIKWGQHQIIHIFFKGQIYSKFKKQSQLGATWPFIRELFIFRKYNIFLLKHTVLHLEIAAQKISSSKHCTSLNFTITLFCAFSFLFCLLAFPSHTHTHLWACKVPAVCS